MSDAIISSAAIPSLHPAAKVATSTMSMMSRGTPKPKSKARPAIVPDVQTVTACPFFQLNASWPSTVTSIIFSLDSAVWHLEATLQAEQAEACRMRTLTSPSSTDSTTPS